MKNKAYIVCVLLAAAQVALAGSRLNPDTYHFVSVWGQIGASTLLNNTSSSIKPGIGVAPSIGVGYRVCHNDFLFQTGLEAQYAYLTNQLKNADITLNMIDTEDDPFIMTARLHDGKDVVNNLSLVLPLLFGYEHYKFYFLVGPEFVYSVYANTSSTSKLNTTANYYDRYIDDFEDMPNHQLYVDKTTSSGAQNLKFKATVYAHAEIGFRLGEVDKYKGANIYRKDYRMYLSLFADYGILNIHNNTSNGSAVIYQEGEQGVQFSVRPALLSSEFNNSKVNPLTLGVKFTVAFQMHEGRNWMIYDARNTTKYQRVSRKSQAVIY